LPADFPSADNFNVVSAPLPSGVELAFVHEGQGGYPLLLLHGYPETKRIWWRNIQRLAGAGFEVVAPDLRGFGDSSFPADGLYDPASHAHDLHALVHGVLGHRRCAVAGGDLGAVVAYDLSLRFEQFVERMVYFNTIPPALGDDYRDAGIPDDPPPDRRLASDYFLRQGHEADQLSSELDTAERRRRYVASFYGHRLWAGSAAFSEDDIHFMTEPFADADRLHASWGIYEVAAGRGGIADAPRIFEKNPTPTLVLYGSRDHVVPASFPARCRVAFTECIGPFTIETAGHFLQWEEAELFNRTVTYFLDDLLAR
jgi:pimeloyl-ACP methyl ester carboxylesterase